VGDGRRGLNPQHLFHKEADTEKFSVACRLQKAFSGVLWVLLRVLFTGCQWTAITWEL